MKRLILAALAPLALAGCTGLGGLAGLAGPAPAPLAETTIDDQGLDAAWRAFDVALDSINLLGDLGVIEPGSPKGRAVAQAIRTVNASMAAAERFAAAGSQTDYALALRDATAGMDALRTALKGS